MTTDVNAVLDVQGKIRQGTEALADDCHGQNFFELDHSLRSLLSLYLPDDLREHMWPHYQRLGELAGNRLDELAQTAENHPPQLHYRDRFGRDEDWVEYHPAYREMERIAFEDFGLHTMSHREGVLGWPGRVPHLAKYAFTYLFVQAEFGLMCPISVTDTSTELLLQFGDQDLHDRYLDKLLARDRSTMLTATQFMTEKRGGSDVGRLESTAVFDGENWRLYGEKWFCSHVDADMAMIIARPDGAAGGSGGIGLFLMPRRLDDGSRNQYRIRRLKPKMGTNSMASGEIVLEGALAYPMGDLSQGLKQMMVQVNLSRLSHGVRAAAMMRRCWNEALAVARSRFAFGSTLMDKPLVKRQLMKLLIPTEQALSMFFYTADQMGRGKAGDELAQARVRILTPLFKFRACRDNITVATGAMEMRGGNGYIEDYVNARLVRDAHIGVLWEGTSNINSIDVCSRAIARSDAQIPLAADLRDRLRLAKELPDPLAARLETSVQRAVEMAEQVGRHYDEAQARKVSSVLYHLTTAICMAVEGASLGRQGGDARRLLMARMVLDHRLSPRDPLALDDTAFDLAAADLLISDEAVSLQTACRVLAN